MLFKNSSIQQYISKLKKVNLLAWKDSKNIMQCSTEFYRHFNLRVKKVRKY